MISISPSRLSPPASVSHMLSDSCPHFHLLPFLDPRFCLSFPLHVAIWFTVIFRSHNWKQCDRVPFQTWQQHFFSSFLWSASLSVCFPLFWMPFVSCMSFQFSPLLGFCSPLNPLLFIIINNVRLLLAFRQNLLSLSRPAGCKPWPYPQHLDAFVNKDDPNLQHRYPAVN